MAAGLEQSYPIYQRLDFTTSSTRLSIGRPDRPLLLVHVRWLFYDSAGELLTDGHYEYLPAPG